MKVEASASPVVLNAHKAPVKEVEVKVKNTKNGKGEKGKKKANSTVVMTVEKVADDAPIPNLVQKTISVEPSGKVVAAKPSEAAEKSANEVEDDRLVELARVAEAEKLNVVIQLAEKKKRVEAAVPAHADKEIHIDVDEENFNDDGAPSLRIFLRTQLLKNKILKLCCKVHESLLRMLITIVFMDDVLLGQGRNSERSRNVHEVFDRMSHIYATPLVSYDPEAHENNLFSAPE
ncbi:hypothetical protein M5689_018949 [Euphorbia peplus]|nr:hypothetical protein M5689_018949 [Euphorbia peplus]